MFAITGITGNVGGEMARALLSAKRPVRAVARDARKGGAGGRSGWRVAAAKTTGLITSHLQALDKPVPMVSTGDIGRVAAGVIEETWNGHRVVELEGPRRVTPNEIASTFARLLGRTVRMETIPREN